MMNKFSWYDASSIEEVQNEVNATVSESIQDKPPETFSVIKAGGIDLLDLMKEGVAKPDKLVNISNIPELGHLTFDKENGLRIGANVTLATIAENAQIKSDYYAFHQAVSQAATPQIRNMATIAGNLAQRTRCWYFRSKHHPCFRKGSGTCYAHYGENQYHAIMLNGACVSVHASSPATALMAFDAAVEIMAADGKSKIIPLRDFFVLPSTDSSRESVLKAHEIITAVILPPPGKKTRSHYIKFGERESNDWPIADVAVVVELSGNKCKKASIVLGAAAPVPMLSQEAVAAIEGKVIDEETALIAGKAAMENATPLSQNGYKVPIFETIIKRALLSSLQA